MIDIGSDFRLKDRAIFERSTSRNTSAGTWWPDAPYGVTELHREAIRGARLVANPGCFATRAILSLAPLVKERLIELDQLVVDGLSGTSGAGAEPRGRRTTARSATRLSPTTSSTTATRTRSSRS